MSGAGSRGPLGVPSAGRACSRPSLRSRDGSCCPADQCGEACATSRSGVRYLRHRAAHVEDDDHRLLRRKRGHGGGRREAAAGVRKVSLWSRCRVFSGFTVERPTHFRCRCARDAARRPVRATAAEGRARTQHGERWRRSRSLSVRWQLIIPAAANPSPSPLTPAPQPHAAGARRGPRRRGRPRRAATHRDPRVDPAHQGAARLGQGQGQPHAGTWLLT